MKGIENILYHKKQEDDYWTGLVLDENFNIITYYSPSLELLNDKDEFKLAEKTLDTLWAGDILALGDDRYKKIIQRIGNIVYITTTTNFIGDLVEYDSVYDTVSIQEIKYSGYQLVAEEEEEDMVFEYVNEGIEIFYTTKAGRNDYWTGLVLDAPKF